jgi:hypothetical protein
VLFRIAFGVAGPEDTDGWTTEDSSPTTQDYLQFLGEKGERAATRSLASLSDTGQILRNLIIPKADGSTTEIDLVYITCQGIFVVEVKNYGGWIFGNERNRYWTQVMKGGHKSRFYNPIWQNRGHVWALQRVLRPLYQGEFINIVVFSDRSTFKDVTVTSPEVWLIHQSELRSLTKRLVGSLPIIIDEIRRDEITAFLSSYAPGTYY